MVIWGCCITWLEGIFYIILIWRHLLLISYFNEWVGYSEQAFIEFKLHFFSPAQLDFHLREKRLQATFSNILKLYDRVIMC